MLSILPLIFVLGKPAPDVVTDAINTRPHEGHQGLKLQNDLG